MARLKSTARSAAAKKAAKTRKPRTAAKKASTTRKRPGPAKKAAVKKAAAKKVAAPRRSVKPPAKISAPKVGVLQSAAEIDQRIAIARRNLQELAEQAAGSSGGSTEELMADRIAAEEAKLEALRRQREKLPRGS